MAFQVRKHMQKPFDVVISDTKGKVIDEVTLVGLSYDMWNELGMQVVQNVTPKKKDINDPSKYVVDVVELKKYEDRAEIQRNALRLAYALDAGGDVDWGDPEPETIAEKAEILRAMDADVFTAFIVALRSWAYGKKVSAKEDADRFPDIPGNGVADLPSEASDD
jgi:hypothetical protein